MTYILYYVSEDMESGDHPGNAVPAGTWSVYSEQYADVEDADPIEGSTVLVSRNHPTEDEANTKARSLQRRSYAENRKVHNAAP